MTKKILALTLASFVMSSVAPALAQTGTTTATTTPIHGKKDKEEREKEREERKEERKLDRAVDLACMQNAVVKRDDKMIKAWDDKSIAIKTALTARRDALKSAWGITDAKVRAEALKKAWRDYRQTADKAHKAFKETKKSTWREFYKDRKECRGRGASEDKTTESVDSHL